LSGVPVSSNIPKAANAPAAESEARVSAPMLKSTWCVQMRCALQSTIAMVTAIASAARGPNSAAPAIAPTALREIELPPISSLTVRATACPMPTSATIASRPTMSSDVP
jgi:hypothetical protein